MIKSRINFKKAIAIFIVMVMAVSIGVLPVSAASPEESGLLPVRAIFEADGADVTWNDDERAINIEWAGNTIVLHTRRPVAYVNDEAVTLQDGVILREGSSFISQSDLSKVAGNELIALNFMARFASGDILGMARMTTPEMQAAVAEVFAAVYQEVLMRYGSFIDRNIADSQEHESMTVFDFAVNSTIGVGGYRVVVNSGGQIEGFTGLGFTLVPLPVPENAAYTAEPVIIGEDTEWALDGLLTMPRGATKDKPVPAVVLVHGSGANNMDQSIFDNRPFHDIADYLSSNGIAVLRYNKRTLTHGAAFVQAFGDEATVWEETIDDAVLAAAILQDDPRISRVYVAGNSLGGILAPKIAEEGKLDGAILLAGSPRNLFEVQYDQNIQSIKDSLSAGLMTQGEADALFIIVEDMLEEARNLPDLTAEEMQGMTVFGVPAVYQRSIMDALPLPIISRNKIPTLILHGDRDFQVYTDKDFNVFVEQTKGYAHVQTKLYDNLNHIFMKSQTEFNDLREYTVPGRVDEQALKDIAEWIHSHK